MNAMAKQALQYVKNTGESVTEAQFDDDNEPIGPQLRADIKGYYTLNDGVMKLTEEGRKLCTN
jgi:hypothetical protein